MKRGGATHTWPALRNLLADRIFAAASRSASANTIAGAWPPSSIVTRFMCLPARLASSLPTTVDPVKEILRHFRRHAEDEVDNASRHARGHKRVDERRARCGCFLGALDDDRAARRD